MKIESAVFETSVGDGSQLFPSTLPEVVFSGRSNVGKSSLINRLLSPEIAGPHQCDAGQDRDHQFLPARYRPPRRSAGIRVCKGVGPGKEKVERCHLPLFRG